MDNIIKLINTDKVSEILCISPKTLRKWRWEGKGPRFIKTGHKVAYHPNDINTYIQQQGRKSTSDTGYPPP